MAAVSLIEFFSGRDVEGFLRSDILKSYIENARREGLGLRI